MTALVCAALIAGCSTTIEPGHWVTDDGATALTLHPDGSAEFVNLPYWTYDAGCFDEPALVTGAGEWADREVGGLQVWSEGSLGESYHFDILPWGPVLGDVDASVALAKCPDHPWIVLDRVDE